MTPVIFFSKLMSKMFPAFNGVGKKIAEYQQALETSTPGAMAKIYNFDP